MDPWSINLDFGREGVLKPMQCQLKACQSMGVLKKFKRHLAAFFQLNCIEHLKRSGH